MFVSTFTNQNRKFVYGCVETYRYGFNGKENDNEVKGNGNQQDYGMRIYDPRLGKFLSLDPLYKSFPELTPYQYASNNPIQNIDLDGMEGLAGNIVPMNLGGPADANNDGKLSKSELKGAAKINIATAAMVIDVLITKGWIGTTFGFYSLGEGVGNGEKALLAKKAGDYKAAAEYEQMSKDGYLGAALTWGPSMLIKGAYKLGVKVNLFSGNKSIPGYVSYDREVNPGVVDDVSNFSKHYGPNSVSEFNIDNPMAPFMEEISPSLQSGGKITLRGQFKNQNFSEVWDAAQAGKLKGYKVVSAQKGISSEGYTQSNGKPIKGEMNEIILQKE